MKNTLRLFSILLMLTFCMQNVPVYAAASAAQAGFVETEITPPQTINEETFPISIIPHNDGSVDYFFMSYTRSGDPSIKRLQSADGGKTWKDIDCGWFLPIAKKHGLYNNSRILTKCIVMDSNGTIYFATGADEKGLTHMYQVKKDGTFQEIPIPAWKTDHESVGITQLALTKEGNFLFSYSTKASNTYIEEIDSKTGQVKQRILDDFQQLVSFSGNVAVVGAMFPELTFFDTSTGKRLRDLPLSKKYEKVLTGSGDAAIFLDENEVTYIMTVLGLERLPKDGSVFETLMDGTRYRFGDPKSSLRKLVKQPGSDVFYIATMLDRELKLYRYAAPGAQK